jgi:hypothetical protein
MAALLLAGPVAAQQPARLEVGGFGQWTRFDENAGAPNAVPENGLGYGGRLGVFLTPNWQIEGDGYYSPQDRKQNEEFCCLGLFPTEVDASAFALRMNYNVPLGARSQLILGAGAVRTKYASAGGNAPGGSVDSYGASGLGGLRMGLMRHLALRLDGVVDYMPSHEPAANVNLHARAGLSLLLGGSERVAAVTSAPPPPQPAPVTTALPAPPPPPVENAIAVCVIDPAQPFGIRMQNALYRVEQGDTVVMQNGDRVPLSQVAGNAMVVGDAGWYLRGEQLSMTVGSQTVRYLAYPSATQIDPNRIAYIGDINGYPVYADRDAISDFSSALNTARAAHPNRDLGAILAERRDLRDALEDVAILYVPLQRTDCIFQPMQLMDPVIKGR